MRESPERWRPTHRTRGLAFVSLLAGLIAFATPGRSSALPQPAVAALRAVELPPESVAVWVAQARGGPPVVAAQAEVAFAPASSIKTLTTIVALDTLGPNWRGATRLLTRAAIAGAGAERKLEGDLVLRGEANVDFDVAQLDQLLLRLRAQGVKHIAGDWIVDRSLFRPVRLDLGVPPFDESPEFRYNAIPDALFLGSNLVALELAADMSDVRVLPAPDLPGVRWRAALELVEAPSARWEDGWRLPEVRAVGSEIEVTLQGRFPKDCVASTQINVIDRDEYVARLLAARWAALGGTLGGRVRFLAEPLPDRAAFRDLAVVRSRSLAEIARDIQRRSDNPIARMIFLALGAGQEHPGESTPEASVRVVRQWLARHRIPAPGLVLDNGSGLSRSTRIAPRTLGEVLRVARRSPWWPEFAYGLPVAGRDGSLARRLRDSAAATLPAPARLKTGTLRDVGALVGYITAADGVEYVFVAMVNHPKATSARAHPVLDALVEWVAQAGWRSEPWGP
ncbi:MAG: D-alanyl-D-alanine carboxypeptidase/D-alanyl-D-alanine-endopeptidase [Casimicrobiaceae bacterium]